MSGRVYFYRGLGFCSVIPIVEFISGLVSGHNVCEQDIFGLRLQTAHSDSESRKEAPEMWGSDGFTYCGTCSGIRPRPLCPARGCILPEIVMGIRRGVSKGNGKGGVALKAK